VASGPSVRLHTIGRIPFSFLTSLIFGAFSAKKLVRNSIVYRLIIGRYVDKSLVESIILRDLKSPDTNPMVGVCVFQAMVSNFSIWLMVFAVTSIS
jgi:hypothetical protein